MPSLIQRRARSIVQGLRLPRLTINQEAQLLGKDCGRCGAAMPEFTPRGGPRECLQCRRLQDFAQLKHNRLVRCPRCLKLQPPRVSVAAATTFNHKCHCECGQSFSVLVSVHVSYESPAVLVGACSI